MKTTIEINKESRNIFSALLKITETDSTIPVCEYLKFESFKSSLQVTAYDIETELTCSFAAKGIDEDFTFFVSGPEMKEILKNNKSNYMTFEKINGGQVKVSTQTTSIISFNEKFYDEFPKFYKKGSIEWAFTLGGKDFANDLHNCLSFILKRGGIRYGRESMYGANVKLYDRFPGHADYRIEATDTWTLSSKQTEKFPVRLDFKSFVLSHKDASILSGIIKGDITIRAMQGQSGFFETLRIYSDNFTYNCHPLKEYFPDVDGVIPKHEPTTTVIVNRKELENAVKATSGFNNRFTFKVNGEFKVTSLNLDFNRETSANILNYEKTGGDIEINFNKKLFLKVLKSIETDTVKLEFSDHSHPVCVNRSKDSVKLICPHL